MLFQGILFVWDDGLLPCTNITCYFWTLEEGISSSCEYLLSAESQDFHPSIHPSKKTSHSSYNIRYWLCGCWWRNTDEVFLRISDCVFWRAAILYTALYLIAVQCAIFFLLSSHSIQYSYSCKYTQKFIIPVHCAVLKTIRNVKTKK